MPSKVASKRLSFLLLAVAFGLAAVCPPAQAARDYTKQPFSSQSPWNYPIGGGAQYAAVSGLSNLGIAMYNTQWTVGIYTAKSTDRTGNLYFNWQVWDSLNSGTKNSGNSASVENSLRSAAVTAPQFPANYYSTAGPGSINRTWPADYHKSTDSYYSRSFQIPTGAVPSPDTDGYIAIYQPNGWVLDAYASVVLSNGDIVTGLGSYIDSTGEGTGRSSGRRASMLPSFAGVIRQGEVASGDIRHALACQMSPAMLKEQAMWPAYAYDMNSGYSGTLPMGALLAIPPSVNLDSLGLSAQGKTIGKALQDYGVYIVDRGGSGMSFSAELGATDASWSAQGTDLGILKKYLQWVSNNGENSRGGGGTPRRALLDDGTAPATLLPPTNLRVVSN